MNSWPITLTEYGPAGLVPAAWVTVIAVSNGLFSSVEPLMIAHGVMVAFLCFFTVVGWKKMDDAVLSVWRLVIAGGIPVTSVGLVGLLIQDVFLVQLVFLYWAIVPGVALIETGVRMPEHRAVFAIAGTVSVVGAVIVGCSICGITTAGFTGGTAVIGIGQTIGIGYTVWITA